MNINTTITDYHLLAEDSNNTYVLPQQLLLAYVVTIILLLPKFLSAYTTHGTKGLAAQDTSTLPHVSSTIPIIGHALQLKRNGGHYVRELILRNPFPLFTIDLLFKKLVVVNPALDRVLAKHSRETSLIQVVTLVAARSLGLSARGIRVFAEYDPRPLHNQAIASTQSHDELLESASDYIHRRLGDQPATQDVQLGRWLFDMVLGATAHSFWGPENPWNADREFMDNFITLSDSFEDLVRPMSWLTAKSTYDARELLIAKLMAFHREHRASRLSSTAHRINAIRMNSEDWEGNPDYYKCELLQALGLLPTTSTLTTWLVRYLLVNPGLRRKVVDEVRRLDTTHDGRRPDLSAVRTTCPHLVAAWYETLRLSMTIVPRVATEDFALPASAAAASADMTTVRKNDVLLLPMLSFNLDAQTWGPDAESFRAERFIDGETGALRGPLTQKVRGFGVAGNLCPGKKIGFDTAMALTATLLRDFDVESLEGSSSSGSSFRAPTRLRRTNVGFDRLGDDVRVRLVRAA
ncbi:cytochrome P450 [Purpureocillium lavendulum]|uniref:Cytochrome P450 n=1 Tax=Purpureocillium lavendulum TaxID=1247861 RepID=A0AB34FTN4_9HYPO|nr:cytochrome P450 [Purpureocillium lavendulum]